MRWGLVPFWAKDLKVGFSNINAKAEGIEGKPAFREAFRGGSIASRGGSGALPGGPDPSHRGVTKAMPEAQLMRLAWEALDRLSAPAQRQQSDLLNTDQLV